MMFDTLVDKNYGYLDEKESSVSSGMSSAPISIDPEIALALEKGLCQLLLLEL